MSKDTPRNFDSFADALRTVLLEFGVSLKTINSVFSEKDNDWEAVIKLHAILDAAITQLIVAKLGPKELAPVISLLELGDRRKGKVAFVKALNLLTSEEINFLRVVSELRNLFAHRITHLEVDLKSHLAEAPAHERKSFKDAITGEGAKKDDFVFGSPRLALVAQTAVIVLAIKIRLLELQPAQLKPNPKGL